MAAPFPFSLTGGPYYEGRLFEGGVDKGSVTLAWVSKFFRRATLEIDTLTGAVRPAPVPDGAGGTEFFDTVFAKIGWQLIGGAGPAQRAGAGRRGADQLLELARICTR